MSQAKCYVATRSLEINSSLRSTTEKQLTNLKATIFKEIFRSSSKEVVPSWEIQWTPSVPAPAKVRWEYVWKNRREVDHSEERHRSGTARACVMITHDKTLGSIHRQALPTQPFKTAQDLTSTPSMYRYFLLCNDQGRSPSFYMVWVWFCETLSEPSHQRQWVELGPTFNTGVLTVTANPIFIPGVTTFNLLWAQPFGLLGLCQSFFKKWTKKTNLT